MSRRRSSSMTSLRGLRIASGSVTITETCEESPSRVSTSSLPGHAEAQTSASSLASVSSHGSGKLRVEKLSRHQRNLAKKRLTKEKKKEEKQAKKLKENKIGKEDYYNKRMEFRTWLKEEKKKQLGNLSDGKSKEYFKKFVKKWNNNKLAKKYYRGISPCWIDGSPCPGMDHVAEQEVVCTPTPVAEKVLEERYGRVGKQSSFGTFGKRLRNKSYPDRAQVTSLFFEEGAASQRLREMLDEEEKTRHLSTPSVKTADIGKRDSSSKKKDNKLSALKRVQDTLSTPETLRKKLFRHGILSSKF